MGDVEKWRETEWEGGSRLVIIREILLHILPKHTVKLDIREELIWIRLPIPLKSWMNAHVFWRLTVCTGVDSFSLNVTAERAMCLVSLVNNRSLLREQPRSKWTLQPRGASTLARNALGLGCMEEDFFWGGKIATISKLCMIFECHLRLVYQRLDTLVQSNQNCSTTPYILIPSHPSQVHIGPSQMGCTVWPNSTHFNRHKSVQSCARPKISGLHTLRA